MTKKPLDLAAAAGMLGRALAEPGQPRRIFEALEQVTGETLGHRLFTVLAWRPEAGEVERLHTSRPAEYPLLGRKAMGPTAWGDVVLKGGGSWFGRSADDIVWAFPDHRLILSLGCESCLNAPVVYDGRVLGVVSVLDAAGRYDEADLAALEPLAQLLAPAFLADNRPSGIL